MQSSSILCKIPLLLGIIWANQITYTSPNPVVRVPQSTAPVRAGYATINMRPPWARTASKAAVRIIAILEVITIISTFTSIDTPLWAHCPELRLSPLFTVGWIVLSAGALLRKACYQAMGRHFTFEVTVRKDHRLVTSGPYSIVRHPSYTALGMVGAGTIMCLLGNGSWLLECGFLGIWTGKAFALAWLADIMYVPFVMVFYRVSTEDEMLKKTFGLEWEEWASRTPYALFPGIH